MMGRFRLLSCAIPAILLLILPGTPARAYLQYGAETCVQADGIDINVGSYSVPTVVDWNEDGLKDLIVGEGGSIDKGKVRVYPNVGSNEAPAFTDFVYARQAEGDLVFPGG
jgi:hypothetical protein